MTAHSHPTAHPRSSDVRTPPTHNRHAHDAGQLAPRKSWALLAVALAAQILVVLDISVVNTALPVHRQRPCTSTAASCSGWSPRT